MTRILAHFYNAAPSDGLSKLRGPDQNALERGRRDPANETYAVDYVAVKLGDARTKMKGIFSCLSAEVVKWQTRTFEGRVAQAVRVQVPPSAPIENP